LAPQALARARPVHGAPGGGRLGQRFAVHPGDHQDLAGFGILGDGRDQAVLVEDDVGHPGGFGVHVSLTAMPRSAMYCLHSRTVWWPRWRMLAARTALGRPVVTPSARCCRLPTPPEAMTGTGTASDTVRVSARSKPDLVPSRSMLVSRISPAP